MAYVTCLVTKNFTFELPGKCDMLHVLQRYIHQKKGLRIQIYGYKGYAVCLNNVETLTENGAGYKMVQP